MKYRYLFCLTALFLTIIPSLLLAEEEATSERPVPELRAYRCNPHAPVIDGVLDDVVWTRADIEYASIVTQREPDDGKAVTESTLVATVYDNDALYVAYWCYDTEPDKIARQLVRRDRWGESDYVATRIDAYHDHQTGYSFEVSAANVQCDARIYNDDHFDSSWDGVWSSGAKVYSWGWTAEMRIPYHCLRFAEKPEHTWGINFCRMVNRKSESSRWAYSSASESGFASRFGHLTGLTGITPARHLEILPYAVSNLESEPKSQGNPDGRRYSANMGVDIKYGLSSDLILDATINPDFGQVELDQPVLNLSSFETRYGEKRPFFVEGSNLFDTDFDLFYSRRIGRSPTGYIDDDRHDYTLETPTATTILAAGKLTGKIADRTTMAVLSAVTQEENARYMTESGVERSTVVEPQANYSVVRVKRDVLKHSNIGGMLTLATQDSRYPATTGGVDWKLRTNDGVWETSGQTVFSRNDNEHTGFGLSTEMRKASGEHIRGAVGFTYKDRYLDLNRLGYLGRNDQITSWLWTQYRTSDDIWIIRNSWNNFNIYGSWNNDGNNYSKGWNINSHFDFKNNWNLGIGANQNFATYDDRETRGRGLWQTPRIFTWNWWASLHTDQRKTISFNLNPGSGENRNGIWWAHYTGLEIRPASNMEFEVGVNYSRSFGQTRWVDDTGDSAMFAELDNDEIFLRASASFMVHRNLSCQFSAEGLITALDYSNYRHYQGGVRYGDELDGYDYDGNYSALNSTMLIRWEYLPGSTLYLVWTRSRPEWDDTANDLDFSRDFDRFFSEGAENIFLVKASYWWNI